MIPTIKISQAPDWLIEKCGKPNTAPKSKNRVAPIAGDSTISFSRVVDYLLNNAPVAVQGSRNDTTFKVAARCKDLGTNETSTHHLMAGHWNDRNEPPINSRELQHAIKSAYRYGNNPQGSNSPEADFKRIKNTGTAAQADSQSPFDPKPRPKRPPLIIEAVAEPNPEGIPPREWILGKHLLAGKVTVIVAPPGVGKSIISMAMAISNSADRSDILNLEVHKRCNTLIINNEDDKDELSRRFAAIINYHEIAWDRLNGRIFMYSGVTRPFLMAKANHYGDVTPLDKDALIQFILENEIKVVVADPFVETHQVDENNNMQINQVGGMYRELAVRTGAAVVLIHHTKKPPQGTNSGYVGDMDGGRGASALAGVARIMLTVYGMSESDASEYGISRKDRHRYVRMDDSKSNMHLISYEPRWFKKVSVTLSNGDEVGVLEPIDLAPQLLAIEFATLGVVQTLLAENNGEMTLHAIAKRLNSDDITGKGESVRTLKRRIEGWLVQPKIVNGWELWSVFDESPNAPGATKHMVYGRIDLEG